FVFLQCPQPSSAAFNKNVPSFQGQYSSRNRNTNRPAAMYRRRLRASTTLTGRTQIESLSCGWSSRGCSIHHESGSSTGRFQWLIVVTKATPNKYCQRARSAGGSCPINSISCNSVE